MRIIRLFLVVAFAAFAASAQYSVVTEAEFKTACGNTIPAPMYLRSQSYRMTIETRSAIEGRPSTDYSSRTVMSYQDRTKWHRLAESTFGSTKRVTEGIGFDGKHYSREANGEWKEVQPAVGSGPAAAKSTTRYINIEYRLYPDELLGDRKVRVCEKYELAAVKTSGSEAESQRESTTKYWVSDEGMLRSESSSKTVADKKNSTFWNKMDWEIDSSIKVSVPAQFAQTGN